MTRYAHPRWLTLLHIGFPHTGSGAGTSLSSIPMSVLLETRETDVTVGVVVRTWHRLLLLKRMVISSPAVASVGAGGGQSQVVVPGGQPGLGVGGRQRVAEQFRRVEGTAGGVGGATAVDGGGVGHLAVGLRVVSQVVVRVGVAGQGPVRRTAGLEWTRPPSGAGATVSPHLVSAGHVRTTAGTSDSVTRDPTVTIPDDQMSLSDNITQGKNIDKNFKYFWFCIKRKMRLPAANAGLSTTTAISNVIIYPRVTRSKNIIITVTKQWAIYLIFANLDDSPELLAPFVLLTDFLCDGVEWWLWLWVSGLRQNISTS